MTSVVIGLIALAVSGWALVRTHAQAVMVEELFRRLTALENDLRGA